MGNANNVRGSRARRLRAAQKALKWQKFREREKKYKSELARADSVGPYQDVNGGGDTRGPRNADIPKMDTIYIFVNKDGSFYCPTTDFFGEGGRQAAENYAERKCQSCQIIER